MAMDDVSFILAYGTFAVAVIGVLLIALVRGVDRKRYLRPVIYGMIFGGACLVLFGGGIFAFLVGGVLTGYLLARNVGGSWNQFRGGAINAVMLESSLFLADLSLLTIRSVSWYLTYLTQNLGRPVSYEELLFSLYGGTFINTLLFIMVVGVGAVLGGMLHKFLKPGEQKHSNGGGVTTSSGVEQT